MTRFKWRTQVISLLVHQLGAHRQLGAVENFASGMIQPSLLENQDPSQFWLHVQLCSFVSDAVERGSSTFKWLVFSALVQVEMDCIARALPFIWRLIFAILMSYRQLAYTQSLEST